MYKHLLIVADSFIAFSGVFSRTMVEESRADRLAYLGVVLQFKTTARDNWQSESIHDCDELFSNILATFHGSCLNKVLVAPLVLEAMHLPCLINCQHGKVITVFVIELCSFLVGKLLFLPWSVEYILD